MSYTVRPPVSRTGAVRGRGTRHQSPGVAAGRGRGSVAARGGASNDTVTGRSNTSSITTNMDGNIGKSRENSMSQPKTDATERIQSRDAYTVIAPDQKKREKVFKQAQKEEDAYNKHKEEKQLKYVSYVGTVGGEPVDESSVRRKAQQQQSQANIISRNKRDMWREQDRKRENKEIDNKKATARHKSEENERRQKSEEDKRQEKLREEHRQKNEAFLARLERQTKGKHAVATQAIPDISDGEDNEDTDEVAGADIDEVAGAEAMVSSIQLQDDNNCGVDDEPLPSTCSNYAALQRLCDIFPQHDQNILAELLDQCDGNIALVQELLVL